MPPLFSTPSSLSTRFLSFEIEGNQIVCHVNITNANLKKKIDKFFRNLNSWNQNTRFFYKQHFYKQRQAEIRKKKKQKLSKSYVCFNEVILLMVMKMRLKMKTKSKRYDANRLRPRNGHKYT